MQATNAHRDPKYPGKVADFLPGLAGWVTCRLTRAGKSSVSGQKVGELNKDRHFA